MTQGPPDSVTYCPSRDGVTDVSVPGRAHGAVPVFLGPPGWDAHFRSLSLSLLFFAKIM